MAYSAPVLEEVVSKVAHQSMPVDRDTRTSLLFNSETGETEGCGSSTMWPEASPASES